MKRNNQLSDPESDSPPRKRVKFSSQTKKSDGSSSNSENKSESKSKSKSSLEVAATEVIEPSLDNMEFEDILDSNDNKKESIFYDHVHIFTDKKCLDHCIEDEFTQSQYNERPLRLKSLLKMIKELKWHEKCHFSKHLPYIPQVLLFCCFFVKKKTLNLNLTKVMCDIFCALFF